MFHLVGSEQNAIWRLERKKEKKSPQPLLIKRTVKQIRGTVFTHLMQEKKKKKAVRRMIEQSTERLADPLLAILDRSAVAMATGSPWLVFGAVSGITAQDFALRTHLGSANMVL